MFIPRLCACFYDSLSFFLSWLYFGLVEFIHACICARLCLWLSPSYYLFLSWLLIRQIGSRQIGTSFCLVTVIYIYVKHAKLATPRTLFFRRTCLDSLCTIHYSPTRWNYGCGRWFSSWTCGTPLFACRRGDLSLSLLPAPRRIWWSSLVVGLANSPFVQYMRPRATIVLGWLA